MEIDSTELVSFSFSVSRVAFPELTLISATPDLPSSLLNVARAIPFSVSWDESMLPILLEKKIIVPLARGEPLGLYPRTVTVEVPPTGMEGGLAETTRVEPSGAINEAEKQLIKIIMKLIRVINIEKMRGTDHDTQPHLYTITKDGIKVFPKEKPL